jgi:phage shock protein E
MKKLIQSTGYPIDDRSSPVKPARSNLPLNTPFRRTNMRLPFALILTALIATPLAAKPTNPLIDYKSFAKLTKDVRPYRGARMLTLIEFKRRAADPKTLVLDARSAAAFAEGHIEGAVNLPFTDFTVDSLAAVIGSDRKRPILIYCNNNFNDNKRPVMTKATPLALNIPTFINLYGYGYKNVWELGEAVTMVDPKVGWVKGAGPEWFVGLDSGS